MTTNAAQAAADGSVVVPIIAALVGAIVGFVGGGGARFILDKRQEYVRAQAYARVIEDELQEIDARLTRVLDDGDPFTPTPLPTSAWIEHRTAVASLVAPEEFFALSHFYRWVGAVNAELASLAEPPLWYRVARNFGVPPPNGESLAGLMDLVRRLLRTLALPSITWLAQGKGNVIRRRRALTVLCPDPRSRCGCGHEFEKHRWETRKRRFRIRWRDHGGIEIAHECNVVGCECSRFHLAGAGASRPIRRLNLLAQAPYLGMDGAEPLEGEDDSHYPATAQRGARVTASGAPLDEGNARATRPAEARRDAETAARAEAES
jgi:hypothetical protein